MICCFPSAKPVPPLYQGVSSLQCRCRHWLLEPGPIGPVETPGKVRWGSGCGSHGLEKKSIGKDGSGQPSWKFAGDRESWERAEGQGWVGQHTCPRGTCPIGVPFVAATLSFQSSLNHSKWLPLAWHLHLWGVVNSSEIRHQG